MITVTDVTDRNVRMINDSTGAAAIVSWDDLRSAASQDHKMLAAVYGRALADAKALRVARCMSHVAAKTYTRAFAYPVSRDENRAAHGNVCVVEECACGATRRTNVNGRHQEVGAWR